MVEDQPLHEWNNLHEGGEMQKMLIELLFDEIEAKYNAGLIPLEKIQDYTLGLMNNPDIYPWKRYRNGSKILRAMFDQIQKQIEEGMVSIEEVEKVLFPTRQEIVLHRLRRVLEGTAYSEPELTADELIDYIADAHLVEAEYMDFNFQNIRSPKEKINLLLRIIEEIMKRPEGISFFITFCDDIIQGMESIIDDFRRIFERDVFRNMENLTFPEFEETFNRTTVTKQQIEQLLAKTEKAGQSIDEATRLNANIISYIRRTDATLDMAANVYEFEYANPNYPQYTICRKRANKIVEIMIWPLNEEKNDNALNGPSSQNGLPEVLSNAMQARLHPDDCKFIVDGTFTPDTVFNIVKFREDGENIVLVEYDGEEFWISPRQIKEIVLL